MNSLVRQTELTKVATSARSLLVGAGILLTTLGIGALMGWMGVLWSQGGFAPGKAVHLTQEQAEALRWATVNFSFLVVGKYVMVMNLQNPAHIKVALLSKGMNISSEERKNIGKIFQEKIYSYSITDWVDEKINFPSEIKLVDRVYVGFHYRQSSDYSLAYKIKNDNSQALGIFRDDEFITDAALIPRPKYYSYTSEDGSPLQAIGVSCANHGVSFFINEYCQYFRENEECKFCTLVPTQNRFNDVLKYKKVSHVNEAMTKIVEIEDRIDFVQLSAGSLYEHDKEVKNYIPYIQIIRKHLDNKGIYKKTRIHLTTMPPQDLDILKELKDAGLDTISFDIECPTQQYFEKYCPGKTRTYGYQGIRRAMEKAVEVFGKGNVFTIIIAGIEPPESFISGTYDLISSGITPTINIYHHDPLTTKMDINEPDPEIIIDMIYEIARFFRKYNVQPGLLGCAHYDIGHEIKKGFFDYGA